jgi:hypothetical protein
LTVLKAALQSRSTGMSLPQKPWCCGFAVRGASYVVGQAITVDGVMTIAP